MKIALKVIGVIAAVVAILICSLGALRNFKDAADVAELETEMAASRAQIETLKKESAQMDGDAKVEMDNAISQAEAAMNTMPSKSTFTTAGALLSVLTLLSILCCIFLFIPNPKIGMALFGLTLIIAIVAVIISPSIDGGLTGGASNRALAIAAAIPSVLTALFVFLLSRKTA